MLTSAEQYLIELINRARLDPVAEAERLGIDLNANLAPGTITTDAKQPLAPNDALHTAATAHSLWMLAADVFSHEGAGGSSVADRITDAGYSFSGWWTAGENLSWIGSSGAIDLASLIDRHHYNLWRSEGHRENMLAAAYREIGIGQEAGAFTDTRGDTWNAAMLTQNFAATGSEVFVTGVAYSDDDGDGFYSMGEGVSGVSISAGGSSDATDAHGGYAVGVGLSDTLSVTLDAAGGRSVIEFGPVTGNIKLDLVDIDTVAVSASVRLVSGVGNATLLGIEDLAAQGNDAANALTGNRGDNLLAGGAGDDTLDGGAGFDTADFGTADGVTVRLWQGTAVSDEGSDTLVDIEGAIGSGGRDLLVGDSGVNLLAGGAGSDALWGGAGRDLLEGGSGWDLLSGGAGADTLDGGSGKDWAVYAGAEDALTIRLWAGTGEGGEADGDVLIGIENVEGGTQRDLIVGDGADNVLEGGGGADALWSGGGDDVLLGQSGWDRLNGGGGRDTLDGGLGNDVLAGGAGGDVFHFRAGYGEDRIVDFASGVDAIAFDLASFGMSSLAEAHAVAAYVSGDTVFDFGGGDVLIVEDTVLSDAIA